MRGGGIFKPGQLQVLEGHLRLVGDQDQTFLVHGLRLSGGENGTAGRALPVGGRGWLSFGPRGEGIYRGGTVRKFRDQIAIYGLFRLSRVWPVAWSFRTRRQ